MIPISPFVQIEVSVKELKALIKKYKEENAKLKLKIEELEEAAMISQPSNTNNNLQLKNSIDISELSKIPRQNE